MSTFDGSELGSTILIGAAEVPLAMVPVAPNPIARIYVRHLYPPGQFKNIDTDNLTRESTQLETPFSPLENFRLSKP
jgi:hypothetical protein